MKIPVVKLDFSAVGYEGHYAMVPRSVKEGFVYDLTRETGKKPKDVATGEEPTNEEQAELARDVNIRFLDLVHEWTLTNDAEEKLPPTREVTGKNAADVRSKKVEIVKEVPIEWIRMIVDKVTASSRVTERVKDF